MFVIADPGIAATNYAACAGAFVSGAYYDQPQDRLTGVFFEDSAVQINDILDGTSNTILVGEVIYYGTGASTSFLWDPSWYGRADTANGTADAPESLHRVGEQRINPPALATNAVKRDSFGSRHPGDAQFALADGSVRFISERIANNQTTYAQFVAGQQLGLFQRLTARKDGLTVSGL
jgi:prepilin-type processing-associated H-X9-DG protein